MRAHGPRAIVLFLRSGLLAVFTANIVIAGYVVSAFREDDTDPERKDR